MNIEIDKDLERSFLEAADKLRKSPSDILSKLMESYLEDMHDYEAGVAGYARYLASGRKGTTLEELAKELNLND